MDVAQRSPFGAAVLSEKELSEFEETSSVLHVGGSAGDQLSLLRTQD